MKKPTKDGYIGECREKVLDFIANNTALISYRKKTTKLLKVGVVVAFKKGRRLYVGASKCNRLDKFNRHIGIAKALERARPVGKSIPEDVPLSMREAYERMVERARRFFSASRRARERTSA